MPPIRFGVVNYCYWSTLRLSEPVKGDLGGLLSGVEFKPALAIAFFAEASFHVSVSRSVGY